MRFQRLPFHNRRTGPSPEYAPDPVDDRAADQTANQTDDEGDDAVKREAEYLRQLTDQQTPVVVHLVSGESLRGFIEYYDRKFIRLTRKGGPNLFIFKQEIKYLSEE